MNLILSSAGFLRRRYLQRLQRKEADHRFHAQRHEALAERHAERSEMHSTLALHYATQVSMAEHSLDTQPLAVGGTD